MGNLNMMNSQNDGMDESEKRTSTSEYGKGRQLIMYLQESLLYSLVGDEPVTPQLLDKLVVGTAVAPPRHLVDASATADGCSFQGCWNRGEEAEEVPLE